MSGKFAFLKNIFNYKKRTQKEENEKFKKRGEEKSNDLLPLKKFSLPAIGPAEGEKKKKDRLPLKEYKPYYPIPGVGLAEEISRSMRDIPPAHYTMKMSFFSCLLDPVSSSIVSSIFEADGYKWRLCVHPAGNKKGNGSGHLSLYLAIAETDSFPPGWEVHASFKFLLFDQIRDKYLTIEDASGRGRRFHETRTEWGFTHALPLHEFRDPSKGYLFEDSCTVGTEVFVSKRIRRGENVTLMWEPLHAKESYSWTINNFSILGEKLYYSDAFTLRGNNWKLALYPRGSDGKGEDLSIFLVPLDFKTLLPGGKQLVRFKLRVKDHKHGDHFERDAGVWFDDSHNGNGWGFRNFMSLDDLNDPSKGSLIDDSLTIEAQVVATSTVEYFS